MLSMFAGDSVHLVIALFDALPNAILILIFIVCLHVSPKHWSFIERSSKMFPLEFWELQQGEITVINVKIRRQNMVVITDNIVILVQSWF